jgi:hypothetical protein
MLFSQTWFTTLSFSILERNAHARIQMHWAFNSRNIPACLDQAIQTRKP